MAQKRSFALPLAVLVLAGLSAALAQAPIYHPMDKDPSAGTPVVSRLAGDWRSTGPAAIPGSGLPGNAPGTDQGAAPTGEPLQRMLLLLKPSAAQQQELTIELANLQNPASPAYHQWLAPAAFAAAYANSSSDVSAVQAWLESAGFTVAPLPAGRGWIEFSGTVAQVEQAFQTRIHTETTAGGARPVLAGGISIPGALSPLVEGLVSLDGELATPALTAPRPVSSSAADLAAQASPGAAQALTPRLAAGLLHLDALQQAGINGAGETIAIAARSNVAGADVDAFRAVFALPAMALKVVPNGADPGIVSTGLAGDQAEATLAASWAGAAAPGAQILLVPAASTAATDGLDLSLAAIVDQALAHTVAVGYSACEAGMSEAHQAFYSALYRQAAAEGIAVIAAAGDSGASACHQAGSDAPVSSGYGVNALASTPWNTAVGVAAYGPSGPAAGNTALAAWSPASAADPAYAGGGGSSALYTRPNWQSGAQLGSQAGGAGTQNRLLPDLVMPTAIDTSVNPGLAFCLNGPAASGGCNLVRSGGSSAAAALFAGIAALAAEKNGAQGNLAPGLYALSGVFADVEQGSAQLKCVAGSPGCDGTGQIGFSAAAGYDLATGLGVPDAHALVIGLASPLATPTGTGAVQVTVTTPPTTINPSALITINAQVVSLIGGATPTGTIQFYDASTGTNLSFAPSTIASNGTAFVMVEGLFQNGANEIVAEYSGDPTYESLNSPPVDITAQPSSTSLAVVPSSYSPAAGASITVTATLTVTNPGNSPPTGLLTLTLDGTPVTSANLFGTTASFSVTIPTVGSHNLQAIYAGDTNYQTSTSPVVTINAVKSATTLTVTPATTTPATGSPFQVTATINTPAGSTVQATGTATFTLDGTAVGTVNVAPGSPSTASITVSVVSSGSHNLQATYSGDNNYNTSTSAPVPIVAGKGATATTLTANPPSLSPGVTETLTATIAPVNPVGGVTYTITGMVSFYDGGATLLGQVTVSNNQAILSGVTLKNNVSHTITAIYSGDGNWLGDTSNALTLPSTTLAAYVVLTSNYSIVQNGVALILTATVTPSVLPTGNGEANPTGSVVFYNGTTVIGISALSPVALTDSSIATLTTQTLPIGQSTITAYYEGDLYYAPATSNPLTITVEDFTITPAASNPAENLNINQGGAGSVSFVITGTGGFNNEVQLVCAAPPQDDMTCTATPQQVVPTATVTFVVQTSKTPAIARNDGPLPIWPRAAGGAALAVLGFFLLPFSRRARKMLRKAAGQSTQRAAQRLVILLLLLAGLVGTGIGCTSNAALAPYGTPLGVATLKVTGSAYVDNTVVSHSIYFTVNVLAPGVIAP